MHKSSIKSVIVLSGALTVFVCTGAQAFHIVTHTDTLSPTQTDFTTTLSLPQFNPTLGTLLSVSLTYGEDVTNTGTLTNGNRPLLFGFEGKSELTQSTLGIDQTSEIIEIGTLSANSSINVNGSQSKTGGPVNELLPFFTGTGNVDFTLTGTGLADLLGGGNISDKVNTNAGGFVSVTYDYNPVPEAGTLISLGGLLAIGGLQLRRLIRKRA